MRTTKLLSSLLSLGMFTATLTFPISSTAETAPNDEIFYDDFSGNTLDTSRWLVAYKNWGGKIDENGITRDYNGGVVPQNVSVQDGKLVLTGHGNNYEGDVLGINRDMSLREDGKRVGAAIATREYFASGSYEVRAKVAPELGACSAIWTFEYEENWDDGTITNHEIDIEMPGRPAAVQENQSFSYALCNTWIGENEGEYRTGYTDIGTTQADGAFHSYRFDWHTGDANETPRVEFYFDDMLTYTSYEYIPTNAGRFWLGVWFPRGWAGTPDFDTTTFEIDYVKITPFHQSGDTPQNETYPDDGWANEKMLPTAPLRGDVNTDGIVNAADAVALAGWLRCDGTTLQNLDAGDCSGDGKLDARDLTLLKRKLLTASVPLRTVHVTDTESLKAALADAQAGDEIRLAPGTYVYSGTTSKGHMFTGAAEGMAEAPIRLCAEDPAQPPVLSGTTTQSNYALTITGDYWVLEDLVVTNASKGIMLDNSNHTILRRCEVYGIGTEGVHFRDNSSDCLAENCYVHDTGLVTPGYGEGFYVGSAKNSTDYGFDCNNNTIRSCRIGPNVTAEHVDVKEYTTGTVIEGCTFDGTGMSGEHYAKSFINIKGNDCIVRENVAYRNGCAAITRAFEANHVVDGWGQRSRIYNNIAFLDTPTNAAGSKMYFLNAWDCATTVWNNYVAYEDGIPFSIDNPDDRWSYYNSNLLTYGDTSLDPSSSVMPGILPEASLTNR